MPDKPLFPLLIFYDGGCSVCAREVEHYLRRDRDDHLIGVDISDPDFDPGPYHISLKDFMYELHAIDAQGRVYRGVEAFWAIWQAFPASTLFGLLGTFITLPLINPLARLGYKGFANIRPYLPKRKPHCSSGSCRIGKDHDQV
ncbi:Predicted thiol-disulfide oxidoreductase YuxK, DCC family [Geoalkalibacter ferrihydriticus]|uniref:Thiol-disulfide oxidoreductase n=2 Tax=Geoalkalibacter ferrihydriticus TaxID=392333 RepID=A0A0C2HXJ0_9BACT|nr:DUF393 domain-containing protein [Geoalkalibacter ferrihydriticus]KIH77482.1 thiol-disulfide oxidoreductase [Geoalkalibacter ferrihydriticus DSM 17813]SDM12864.1 Predicted thiol-disulfide oxidoreductase YuxK, DCC family [Geoalkalibacter ferrihydriticus]